MVSDGPCEKCLCSLAEVVAVLRQSLFGIFGIRAFHYANVTHGCLSG